MYIRVSEILGRLQNFGNIDPEVLRNKADIGTNVHQAIIDDTCGDFPILKCERSAAYFGSYEIWKNKEKPTFKIQVPRLYDDELMITGEIDGIIETNRHNLPVLIDWKCSANANEEIWEMQAHFYWYLLNKNGIDVSKEKMIWVNLRAEKYLKENNLFMKWNPSKDCEKNKVIFKDKDGNETYMKKIVEKVPGYRKLPPKIHEFSFKESVFSRCVEEALKAWEEKNNSKMLD